MTRSRPIPFPSPNFGPSPPPANPFLISTFPFLPDCPCPGLLRCNAVAIRQGATADHRTVEVKKPKSGRKEKKKGRPPHDRCLMRTWFEKRVFCGARLLKPAGIREQGRRVGWSIQSRTKHRDCLFSRIGVCCLCAAYRPAGRIPVGKQQREATYLNPGKRESEEDLPLGRPACCCVWPRVKIRRSVCVAN